MKKFNLLLPILFLCTLSTFAQTPQKMSYQAIVRNSSDMIITNQNIGMQISILQGSASGSAVYVETQTPTTNTNGLASIEIGTGTVVSGNFSTIDWANSTYFIKTEIDPTGSTNYSITGTSQLASVPYALYAANSGNSTPGPQGPAGDKGLDGTNGTDGNDGDSAYQIWLNAGNTGSEAAFLAALKGDQGDAGSQGIQGIQGVAGNDGADGTNGTDGNDGDSAYQIWLNAGNTGNEAAFLAALKGDQGDAGSQGIQGIQGVAGNDGANGINGTDGNDGDSAYQIWLNAGNTGNEATFLAALKGEQGDAGDQGIQGVAGNDGADGTNGTDGNDGDSAYQIWLNAGNTGNEAAFLATLKGDQGIQGIQGVAGSDGAKGDKGDQGEQAPVIDNLTTTNTTEALSANQGKVLKDLIDTKVNTTIVNNLTTGGTTEALSAEQGKVLEDTKLTNTLADTNILVGNGSNEATAVVLSGDATLANDGALTIVDNAVDGTDISLTAEATGDMVYFNGTDWVRLPKGVANQSLVMNSAATAPEWQSGGTTEDVEVILGSATGGNGTTISIPANISDYQYLRLESDNWDIASSEHSVHGTVLVSNMASKRILIYADGTDYLHADINASRTSMEINCTGTADWRLVGIKAQKAVIDPSLTTVIDDDTFATASSSNVPSAESVKTYVDNAVPTMSTHPSLEIRFIDIGDVRMQWGVITVNDNTQLSVYEMGSIEGSSLTATVMAASNDTNVFVAHANIIANNLISFNVKRNGTPTTATLRWFLISPKP